jgi:hypothetical protein
MGTTRGAATVRPAPCLSGPERSSGFGSTIEGHTPLPASSGSQVGLAAENS